MSKNLADLLVLIISTLVGTLYSDYMAYAVYVIAMLYFTGRFVEENY